MSAASQKARKARTEYKLEVAAVMKELEFQAKIEAKIEMGPQSPKFPPPMIALKTQAVPTKVVPMKGTIKLVPGPPVPSKAKHLLSK